MRNVGVSTAFEAWPCKVEDLPGSAWRGVDLVIAGTDSAKAQAFISDRCIDHGIPWVGLGAHELGDGGSIDWWLPERHDPCLRCRWPDRYGPDIPAAATDLAGAPALGVDIVAIDTLGMRIALSILDQGQATRCGEFFDRVTSKFNYVIVGNHPHYAHGNEMVDALTGDLPDDRPLAKELKATAFQSHYSVLQTIEHEHASTAWRPLCACRQHLPPDVAPTLTEETDHVGNQDQLGA